MAVAAPRVERGMFKIPQTAALARMHFLDDPEAELDLDESFLTNNVLQENLEANDEQADMLVAHNSLDDESLAQMIQEEEFQTDLAIHVALHQESGGGSSGSGLLHEARAEVPVGGVTVNADVLSDEQRQQIEQNRQAALAKRAARHGSKAGVNLGILV